MAKKTKPSEGSKPKKSSSQLGRKLDPLLTFTAMRTAQEPHLNLSTAATTLGLQPQAARSVSEIPYALTSLAAQMVPEARSELIAKDLVPVLIESDDVEATSRLIVDAGGTAEVVSARTISAKVPRSILKDLEKSRAVKIIEASVKLRPTCDLAHRSSGLLGAEGMTRRVPETGKGVLIGVIDTGIDVSHPSFQTPQGTRIISYVDQKTDQQLTQQQIAQGQGFPDTIGHGTHVSGIAAGNGSGAPNRRYAGVAPEADIAVVKTTFQSDRIALAMRQLFDLAASRSQPCVVNLSLGGHYGGHDGTTLAERVIDQLSGPGRIVVVSAGNEGRDSIHASTILTRSNPPARWVANFRVNKRLLDGDNVGLLVLQVWHQHEDDLLVRIRTPSGEFYTAPNNGHSELSRQSFIVQGDNRVASYSGDQQTTYQIVTAPQPQWLSGWSLIVEDRLTNEASGVRVGPVHAWILDQEMGGFTAGAVQSHLVGMPGTAFSAITVASYATRREWTSIDPTNTNVVLSAVNVDDISYFSSPGPTRDGENKPEIAAPGQWLIAPLSEDANSDEVPDWLRIKDVPFAALQGTSMAAPYVTGALALLLQKEPTLDWAEAKRRLIKSASQDQFSLSCWNNRWGFGKLDVERLLTIEPTPDPDS